MGAADDKIPMWAAERAASADLAQLMATARANTVDAMERLLESAQTGELPHPFPSGTSYLRFVCAGQECAVALSALREVLPTVPRTVYLPFSPEWMLGIFPLRNEMLGLVDPVPLLTHSGAGSDGSGAPGRRGAGVPDRAPATALVVGSDDRCLAWAVDSVGDIAQAQDDELHDMHDVDEQMARDLPFVRRYVARVYTPRESGGTVFVVNGEALLTDLLNALEVGGEGHHG